MFGRGSGGSVVGGIIFIFVLVLMFVFGLLGWRLEEEGDRRRETMGRMRTRLRRTGQLFLADDTWTRNHVNNLLVKLTKTTSSSLLSSKTITSLSLTALPPVYEDVVVLFPFAGFFVFVLVVTGTNFGGAQVEMEVVVLDEPRED